MDNFNNFYMNNDELRDYFCSLEPIVQKRMLESNTEISTLGELMSCSENIRKQIFPKD